MNSKFVKIVVFAPIADAESVRKAMGEAGAGVIGNYTHSSFSSRGIGRFTPQTGATPAVGAIGKPEEVEEERIEMRCPREIVDLVVGKMKAVHPYEEVAYDIYPLESF